MKWLSYFFTRVCSASFTHGWLVQPETSLIMPFLGRTVVPHAFIQQAIYSGLLLWPALGPKVFFDRWRRSGGFRLRAPRLCYLITVKVDRGVKGFSMEPVNSLVLPHLFFSRSHYPSRKHALNFRQTSIMWRDLLHPRRKPTYSAGGKIDVRRFVSW